jgi:hypothetical protein
MAEKKTELDRASFGILLRPICSIKVWWIWIGAMLLCLTRAAKCKSDEHLIYFIKSRFSDTRRSQEYNHTSSSQTVVGFVAWMQAPRCVRRLERSAIARPGARLAYMRVEVQLRRVLLNDERSEDGDDCRKDQKFVEKELSRDCSQPRT